MSEPHSVLNSMSRDDARSTLARCCGSSRWVNLMLDAIPFASTAALLETSREAFAGLSHADYLEAFACHPAIGDDVAALSARFPRTADLSRREQSGVAGASLSTLEALRDANVAYRTKFGFLFIVCATGKTAEEMLSLLCARLAHDADRELDVAAGEQMKITELRLKSIGA